MTPPERGAGERAHFAALERLYAAAPINRLYPSRLAIERAGEARIAFTLGPEHFHAAGAVHGTAYFKMLDDAAFYAANSLVSDRFLLTTGMTLFFTRPMRAGEVVAHGRWAVGAQAGAGGRGTAGAGRRGGGARDRHLPGQPHRARRPARLSRSRSVRPPSSRTVTARLTTGILVAALRRMAEREGGTATVLRRGDPRAGGLMAVLAERGRVRFSLERRTGWEGELLWDRREPDSGSAENHRSFEEMLQRRIAADPDLWQIELDIPDAERFAAEMGALG